MEKSEGRSLQESLVFTPKSIGDEYLSTSTNYHYLPEETQKELNIISSTLVTKGKGILSSDESIPTIGRRLKEIGVENSEENRKLFRQILFSTNNLEDYISGVTLFHETLYQKTEEEDVFLIDLLREKRIVPGIKVDKGVVPLYGTEDECVTQGLDDLGPRCEQYKKLGCHFAKVRCVFKVGHLTPSEQAIDENAFVLARFASVCQAYRMVPVLEPEVLSDGNHNILKCQSVTEKVLSSVYKALNSHNVFLEGTLLKPNMVTPGVQCKVRASPEEIGEATLLTLRRTVPAAVSGITFLSGGQSEEDAARNLKAINQTPGVKPWPLTFNYGRALQIKPLQVWSGRPELVENAKQELLDLAKSYGEAASASLELHEPLGETAEGTEEQNPDSYVEN